MPESELAGRALRVLRRLHGDAAVPDPTAVAVSRWAGEPFARGSYSYVAVGASGREYDQLAAPVGGQVSPWDLL